jgi:hypothetical protein
MEMLKATSLDRWVYFFNECLQSNERTLYKSLSYKPLYNWFELFSPEFIDKILPEISEKDVINLLKFNRDRKFDKISSIVRQMIKKLGYTTR